MHIAAAVFTACVATAFVSAAPLPQEHPHFKDGGALQWHTRLDAAKEAAKKSDRLILVEYGREA